MPCVSQKEGLQSFLQWLHGHGEPTILVAHNCHSFDMRVLVNCVRRAGLDQDFASCVKGFADTLPALKNAVSDASSHSLPKLYKLQLRKSFAAHTAEADVRALSQLCHHTKAAFLSTTVPWDQWQAL